MSWTPSASSGSSALAGYSVTGGNGCNAGPGDSSCVVSGLLNSTPYSFTVTAANAEGATATSGASNSVTHLAACTFNGSMVPSGGSVTAFAQSAVPSGGVCQQQTRWCLDGVLSGSYAHASCQVAPGAPTGVQAVPVGGGQVTVTWQAPADAGSDITGYVVTAQPGGLTCTPTPATATTCIFTGLDPNQTYSFSVQANNSAGGSASSAPSNPVTPLANPKAFSAPSPTNTGTVQVQLTSGGGAACAFEHVQLLAAANANPAPPVHVQFPHGLLDFVLAGCDATDVTLTITYPTALPQGVAYWKPQGGTWGPYGGATVAAGAATATLVLKDGGQGDDDGQANGRIVDPGGVGVMAGPGGSAAAIPTLSQWGLVLLAGLLTLLGQGLWGKRQWQA